ncbi:glycosyltransferase, partial [Helicobacter typhlonius]|uniref:glycosyltransferase n=1 Tax=Helicobacter typhlonius TaxID=76936 RepID=UPI002FE27407
MAKLSLIVPCYNEAANIDTFYTHIMDIFATIWRTYTGTQFELIFVNDGSKDETLQALYRLKISSLTSGPPAGCGFFVWELAGGGGLGCGLLGGF